MQSVSSRRISFTHFVNNIDRLVDVNVCEGGYFDFMEIRRRNDHFHCLHSFCVDQYKKIYSAVKVSLGCSSGCKQHEGCENTVLVPLPPLNAKCSNEFNYSR